MGDAPEIGCGEERVAVRAEPLGLGDSERAEMLCPLVGEAEDKGVGHDTVEILRVALKESLQAPLLGCLDKLLQAEQLAHESGTVWGVCYETPDEKHRGIAEGVDDGYRARREEEVGIAEYQAEQRAEDEEPYHDDVHDDACAGFRDIADTMPDKHDDKRYEIREQPQGDALAHCLRLEIFYWRR